MAEEHDLSTLTGLEGCDEKFSDASEFREYLNAHHLSYEKFRHNWIFWMPETYHKSPAVDRITVVIQEKIKHLLANGTTVWQYAQFWAPKVVGKRRYLTTSDQPFSVGSLYKGLCWYRKLCVDYQYIVDEGAKEEQLGAVGRVFLNGHPESSPDLRLYTDKELPLRVHAARCGARRYLIVPVFDLHKTECYGVLEFLSFNCGYTEDLFLSVEQGLQEAELRSTHIRHRVKLIGEKMLWTYEREQEAVEIKNMLEAVIELVPQLHMAQAWASCKQCANSNNDFYCMETSAFINSTDKIVNSCENVSTDMFEYLVACEYHNLRVGKEIIATIVMSSNDKFYFCRNLCDFSITENPLVHYAQKARLSYCFTICLESVHNNKDFHFLEFFLQSNSTGEDPVGASFWKLLFLIMEIELKSFKVPSSGQQQSIVEVRKCMPSSFEFVYHNMSRCRYGILEQDHQHSNESKVLMMMIWYEKRCLSEYLDDHLSCLKPSERRTYGWVYWCPDREELCQDEADIQEKIKLLLGKLISEWPWSSYSLVQFWAPKMYEERTYLSTSGQPFALGGLRKGLGFFRKQCLQHHYFVDQGAKEEELGPPGRVFRRGNPEITHDLRLYSTKEFPLITDAMRCNLRRYIAFPMFSPQHKCVGILEFVEFRNITLEHIKILLEAEHLYIGLCELVPKFEASLALTEIKKAFQLVAEIPQLHEAEVWVPHNNCASTRNSLNCMERVLYSKWCEDEEVLFDVVETGKGIVGTVLTSKNKCCYCRNSCHFSISEQSRPHLAQLARLDVCFAICLQSSHTGDLPYVLKFFLNQGPANYEYLWSFLYCLLPILRQQLKSFKVATGKQLGEELVVNIIEFSQVNQHASIQSGKPNMFPVKFPIVLYSQQEHGEPSNKIERVASVAAEGKQSITMVSNSDEKDEISGKTEGGKRKTGLRITLEDLERQFGKSRKDAAENLSVSISTFKRACRSHDIHRWPSDRKHRKNPSLFMTKNATEHDRDTRPSTSSSHLRLLQNVQQTNTESTQTLTLLPETDVVIIKAKYEDDIVKFQLSLSSGINRLSEEVAMRLNLEMASFKLKYVDEDNDEVLLTCDIDLKLCIKSLTASGNNCIQVIVQLICSK